MKYPKACKLALIALIWLHIPATFAADTTTKPLTGISYNKPRVGVKLVNPSKFNLPLRKKALITLEFDLSSAEGELHFRIEPGSELKILKLPAQLVFQTNEKKRISLPIEVYPIKDGMHFLHVFVTQRSEERQMSSAMAVAINAD